MYINIDMEVVGGTVVLYKSADGLEPLVTLKGKEFVVLVPAVFEGDDIHIVGLGSTLEEAVSMAHSSLDVIEEHNTKGTPIINLVGCKAKEDCDC